MKKREKRDRLIQSKKTVERQKQLHRNMGLFFVYGSEMNES